MRTSRAVYTRSSVRATPLATVYVAVIESKSSGERTAVRPGPTTADTARAKPDHVAHELDDLPPDHLAGTDLDPPGPVDTSHRLGRPNVGQPQDCLAREVEQTGHGIGLAQIVDEDRPRSMPLTLISVSETVGTPTRAIEARNDTVPRATLASTGALSRRIGLATSGMRTASIARRRGSPPHPGRAADSVTRSRLIAPVADRRAGVPDTSIRPVIGPLHGGGRHEGGADRPDVHGLHLHGGPERRLAEEAGPGRTDPRVRGASRTPPGSAMASPDSRSGSAGALWVTVTLICRSESIGRGSPSI